MTTRPWIISKNWRTCIRCASAAKIAVTDRTATATCTDCGRVETYWLCERLEDHVCEDCQATFTTRVRYHDDPQWARSIPRPPSHETSCQPCRLEIQAGRYATMADRLIRKAEALRQRRNHPSKD